jgi:hypothetical protein
VEPSGHPVNNHVRWNNFQAWLSNAKRQMVTRWGFSVIGCAVSEFGLKNKSLDVGLAARALGAEARMASPTYTFLFTTKDTKITKKNR